HDALQAHEGAHGGRGHAVLARAGFGHNAPLAQALGHQYLADGVVNLVRAGVAQVLALEVDGGVVLGRQALGQKQRRSYRAAPPRWDTAFRARRRRRRGRSSRGRQPGRARGQW
nr:hypothetical protein [Tanacetum cinerariifolium]